MKHQTLLKRIFNIGKKEWGRVGIAWGARFLWRTAYMIAWTVLTVLVIQSFGVANLPWFYVAFGLLTMLGPIIFTAFLQRFSNEKSIFALSIIGAVMFAVAVSMQHVHHYLFIFLSVLTFSIVISQLNIILSFFQEDIFSPRESIRTFPVIESAETIGGIAAGFILTLSVGIIEISNMILYVSGLLVLIIPIIYLFLKEGHKVTHIKRKNKGHETKRHESFIEQIKDQFAVIRKTEFLKGLAVIVLLNAMFLSMIEFQFTTVLGQEVEQGKATSEHSMIFRPWSEIGNELAGTWSNAKEYLSASVLDKPATCTGVADCIDTHVESTHQLDTHQRVESMQVEDPHKNKDSSYHTHTTPVHQTHVEQSPKGEEPYSRTEHGEETVELHSIVPEGGHHSPEEALTHGLSRFHIIFSLIGLMMQLLIASRIIGRLGVIQSMIFHSIVGLLTVIGMFFQFHLTSVAIARGNVEGSGVIYKNSYHASFYALGHEARIYAKEFMEGVIHPFGFAFGTGILIVLTHVFDLSTTLIDNTVLLGIILSLMLLASWKLRDHYTNVSKKYLEKQGEDAIKFDAIEVLSQKGHKDAHFILSHSLLYKDESDWVKVKILDGMAQLKHPATLSEVTNELASGSVQVQTQAAKTIYQFQEVIAQHASDKVVSRYRIINTLHEVFKETKSNTLKKEVIKALSRLEDENVVKFLLNVCSKKDETILPDVIFALRMFNDANTSHYLWDYLNHKNAWIKAHAIITLWDFKKFRLKLLMPLNQLLESKNPEEIKAALFVIGEVKMKNEFHRLTEMITHKNPGIKFYAAIALAKTDHKLGHTAMLDILTHADLEISKKASAHLDTFSEEKAGRIHEALDAELTSRINEISKANKNIYLEEFHRVDLELLHHYYTLLRDFKEVMYLEKIMGGKPFSNMITAKKKKSSKQKVTL